MHTINKYQLILIPIPKVQTAKKNLSSSRTGKVDIMKKVVGFEIEHMTKRTTSLFIAAQRNQKKMVEYLMDHCKIVNMLLDKDGVEEKDNFSL